MVTQFTKQLTYGQLFCGVEHTNVNSQEQINALILKKKNTEFLIHDTLTTNAIVSLKESIPKQQHLFLIINNEKVLFKSIDDHIESNKAIASVFPNLTIEDFYVETYAGENKTFIAICRKTYIDALIKDYTNTGFNIIGFSLGNLAISQLTDFVNDKILTTSNRIVTFEDKVIQSIVPSDNIPVISYDINGLEISPNNVLPLSGILTYYTNQQKNDSNFSEAIAKLKNSFRQKRIFNLGWKSGMATIFLLLLISFLFFSGYTSKINELNAELELNKSHKNTLLKLTDEVQKKEQFVADFSMASSKTSWYLDQLGQTIPSSIILTEIQLYPLEKTIKENQEIIIEEKVIVVRGDAANNKNFTSWIRELEKLDWIDKVVINEYGTAKTNNTEFELLIEIGQ